MSPRPSRVRPTAEKTTLKPSVEGIKIGAAPAQSQTHGVPDSQRPRAGSEDMPRYRQAVRGESRLWPEQKDQLARLRRAVAASRTSAVETISDNVLVRIAVDLLLDNRHLLSGDTEDELRRAVLNAIREAQGREQITD